MYRVIFVTAGGAPHLADPAVQDRLVNTLEHVVAASDVELISIDVGRDHAQLAIRGTPTTDLPRLIFDLKYQSTHQIRTTCPDVAAAMGDDMGLWSVRTFIGTVGNVPITAQQAFIDAERRRARDRRRVRDRSDEQARRRAQTQQSVKSI